ncbi:uncharacterized protein LOC130934028 [Arachis stenosperma]|uniref:uncharacterized protein LOC130934028 n=1 Tax=Arachis stenosperma TaxID=217475 RepID=UPI0025AC8A07|nr:uncharacterized protein LOC130934028 [Arachis stenosperma]
MDRLFKIHARSHRVIDHIIPPKQDKEKMPTTKEEKELWSTLDAMVLQWIYATISHDLLYTILEPDTTAMEAWNKLRDIFQDNRHSRAVTLEYDFTHVDMADFSNISAYCQHLKSLSDQLKNVGSPVNNNRLVLQLVFGLTEPYNSVVTLISQNDPLPQFYQARSMLTLEEVDLVKKVAHSSSSGMVARYSNGPHDISDHASSHRNNTGRKRNQNRSYNGRKNRSNNGGCGGEKGSIRTSNNRGIGQQPTGQQPPINIPWYGGQPWPWMAPWAP